MSNASDIFEAFYSRMLLRDIAGKVIPGITFIISVSVMILPFTEIQVFLKEMSVIAWLVLFGISWIVAFSIQSFAESFKLIRYYPKELTREEWYSYLVRFYKVATDQEKQNFERFVVIKEACGNSYVSFMLSFVAITISFITSSNGIKQIFFISNISKLLVLFLVVPFIIYWLMKMHFYHVQRQYVFLNTVLKKERVNQSLNRTVHPSWFLPMSVFPCTCKRLYPGRLVLRSRK